MANITVSVSNTNYLIISTTDINGANLTITRAVCKGNTITYSTTDSANSPLPSEFSIEPDANLNYQFIEDGLYRLSVETGLGIEIYYIRVTSNIEACERSLIQDIYCGLEDCDKYGYNQKISKLLVFFSYKDRLYSLLNSYQQEQSNASLISIPEAERLTVCQYFCILKDMCGCVEQTYYDNVITDCGCNK